MKKFKVKLKFIYSDVVTVEAESEDEAIEKAVDESDEKYETLYDAKVTEITEIKD